MRNIRVGVTSLGYQARRSIVGLTPDCTYRVVKDGYSLLRAFASVLPLRNASRWSENNRHKFRDFGLNKVDLIHLYNGVSYGAGPWLTSFETVVPRFAVALQQRLHSAEHLRNNRELYRALRCLASDSCKGIICASNNSMQMQLSLLQAFPEFEPQIVRKIEMVAVPQELGVLRSAKQPDRQEVGSLNFLFVGRMFFVKGGVQILNALESLRRDAGVDIRLTVVSSLGTDSYASRTTGADVEATEKRLRDMSAWVTWHRSLPNSEVLRLMETADVGLLPSFAETYGFVVLEYQSRGKPVITTDIRSFPEINPVQCGWQIPVPKHPNGEARYREEGGRERVAEAIENGLRRTVMEILENPALLAAKGAAARSRIAAHHSPRRVGEMLRDIYEKALDS